MESSKTTILTKRRILRCVDWLRKQNNQEPKRSENFNDIQFIVETNADRKNFLLSSIEDDASVPAGVDEVDVKPVAVPLHRLRIDKLRLECEWPSCQMVTYNYEIFQKHILDHTQDLRVIATEKKNDYMCLWDVCGYKTENFQEMVRHINQHAYHSKLLAIGFNARATLKLPRCNKDSSKRNHLPILKSDFKCLWTGCGDNFNSMQIFLNHVKNHITYVDAKICSWGGCGSTFKRRVLLSMHVRKHTGERVIACYHCGKHFATNTKLGDHLHRQNPVKDTDLTCQVCSAPFSCGRLLREHTRQHVSIHACTLCDMTAPTLAALASHVRYRHLGHDKRLRMHKCPHCDYRAITNSDLKKHIPTHSRKKKRKETTDKQISDDDTDLDIPTKRKTEKKYCCHMCKKQKLFSRGTRLTSHLVNMHGLQRPFGYSRFRYQISDDGMYRLTTTRIESLEVSKIVYEGASGPKKTLNNTFDVELVIKSEPTKLKPQQFAIKLKEANDKEQTTENSLNDFENGQVEITMCDVDAQGNVIHSEIVKSDVLSDIKIEHAE